MQTKRRICFVSTCGCAVDVWLNLTAQPQWDWICHWCWIELNLVSVTSVLEVRLSDDLFVCLSPTTESLTCKTPPSYYCQDQYMAHLCLWLIYIQQQGWFHSTQHIDLWMSNSDLITWGVVMWVFIEANGSSLLWTCEVLVLVKDGLIYWGPR